VNGEWLIAFGNFLSPILFEYGLMSREILQMETHATTKGQIVIPAILRRKYGIKEGTRILVFDNGDSIVLKPMTDEHLKKLQGSLKGTGALKELIDERRKDKLR
jgi:AbrB family looped-hinge helix DNA binding protein